MSGRGGGWSPFLSSSSRDREAGELALERESDALERTLSEHGVLSRRELGRLVGCRFWGPGRYGAALRAAVRRGRIRRVRRGRYAPVEERDRASS
jgi:hypothetical protein